MRFIREDIVNEGGGRCLKEGMYIEGEEYLRPMARLDWAKAEPVLEKHVVGGEPRLVALAMAIQLEHASKANAGQSAEDLRNRLKSIVADKKAPGIAREFAVRGLLALTWDGRDDWYLSLFEDATL